MNHSAEIAALKRQNADLQDRLAAIELRLNPSAHPQPQPEYAGFGPPRDGQGNIVPHPDADELREREQRQQRENEQRRAASEAADRAAFNGHRKDSFGFWRDAGGNRVPDDVAAQLEARAQARERGEVVQGDPAESAIDRLPGDVRKAMRHQFTEPGYVSTRGRAWPEKKEPKK